MAVTKRLDTAAAAPVWPASIDPAQMLLAYNPLADELVIVFEDAHRPHIVEPLDEDAPDYVSLLLDLVSDTEVVGIMVESARSIAVAEHPGWRTVVNAAPSEPGLSRLAPSVWPELAAFVADVRTLAGKRS